MYIIIVIKLKKTALGSADLMYSYGSKIPNSLSSTNMQVNQTKTLQVTLVM